MTLTTLASLTFDILANFLKKQRNKDFLRETSLRQREQFLIHF